MPLALLYPAFSYIAFSYVRFLYAFPRRIFLLALHPFTFASSITLFASPFSLL
jgi:hypothetical protein